MGKNRKENSTTVSQMCLNSRTAEQNKEKEAKKEKMRRRGTREKEKRRY